VKLNSISGVTHRVKDLPASIKFYESLGFRMDKQDDQQARCYVNWFWIDLVADSAADAKNEGASLHIKVVGIDEYYQGVLDLGMKPNSEPEKKPSGDREFVLSDPDGHQLVFFEKK
jgi:catechol 2,3-dioxygenase-like lactoylglutathione lyase family enzyme